MQKQTDFNGAVRTGVPQADEFERQLEERIAEMEKPGYRFPARFGRKDYVSAAIVSAVCLVLIVIGGAL